MTGFRIEPAKSRAADCCRAIKAQLPWRVAFAIQELVSGVADAPIAVTLAAVPDAVTLELRGFETPSAAATSRRATRALLRGDVDQAMQYVRGIARAASSAALDLPVRVSGLSPDELLLVDHSEIQTVGATGRLLYRGINLDGVTTMRHQIGAGQRDLALQASRRKAVLPFWHALWHARSRRAAISKCERKQPAGNFTIAERAPISGDVILFRHTLRGRRHGRIAVDSLGFSQIRSFEDLT
jgi:hypothetical protein